MRGDRTRRPRALPVLCLGLLLAAGCSADERPKAAEAPPPPPTRALVDWSTKVCSTVKKVDGLRTATDKVTKDAQDPRQAPFIDATIRTYINDVSTTLDQVTGDLGKLPPSGVREADTFTGELVSALRGVRSKLPRPETALPATEPVQRKPAKAREITGVVATIQPQAPRLARIAETTPELASSYNLAPDCTPVKQTGKPTGPAPTRALVSWSTTMCAAGDELDRLKKKKPAGFPGNDPRLALIRDMEKATYVDSVKSDLTSLTETLTSVPPSGITEADDYRSNLVAAIRAAIPKLPEGDEDIPLVEREVSGDDVEKARKTIAAIKPEGSDLPAVAARHPSLRASYDLAPTCVPLTASSPSPTASSLPTARDGTSLRACESGRCQVRIDKKAKLTVNGLRTTITVDSSGVTVAADFGVSRVDTGGTVKMGSGGTTVVFRVLGRTDTAAVLDISTEKG